MPTILLLGASISQLAAIRQARAAGLRVVAVDGDPGAVGFAEADVAVPVDFSDLAAVVDAGRRHRVDGVVAISSDRAVPAAAAAAERLGVPGIGIDVARAMTDKGVMRQRLAAHGVPQPPFAVADSPAAAATAFTELGPPLVVKPVDSGGQRGLARVDAAESLPPAVRAALAHSRSGVVVLERYLGGRELNVIAVVRRGRVQVLTVSDRLRPPGRGFGVGWMHRFPSTLPGRVLDEAAAVAADAVRALGLRDGIAFPQLLVADGRVYVVEVAARIAAGQMADLVRHGVGVDLVRIALEQALGRPVPDELIEPRPARPIVIRFLTASPGTLPTGRLVAVEGFDRVRSAPGILDAGLYLEPGEVIRPVQVDADRRGYVVATGGNVDAALAAADAALARLVVRTERVDETAPV